MTTYSSITQQQLSLSNQLLTLQASDLSALLYLTPVKNWSNPNVAGLRWLNYTPISATSGNFRGIQQDYPTL